MPQSASQVEFVTQPATQTALRVFYGISGDDNNAFAAERANGVWEREDSYLFTTSGQQPYFFEFGGFGAADAGADKLPGGPSGSPKFVNDLITYSAAYPLLRSMLPPSMVVNDSNGRPSWTNQGLCNLASIDKQMGRAYLVNFLTTLAARIWRSTLVNRTDPAWPNDPCIDDPATFHGSLSNVVVADWDYETCFAVADIPPGSTPWDSSYPDLSAVVYWRHWDYFIRWCMKDNVPSAKRLTAAHFTNCPNPSPTSSFEEALAYHWELWELGWGIMNTEFKKAFPNALGLMCYDMPGAHCGGFYETAYALRGGRTEKQALDEIAVNLAKVKAWTVDNPNFMRVMRKFGAVTCSAYCTGAVNAPGVPSTNEFLDPTKDQWSLKERSYLWRFRLEACRMIARACDLPFIVYLSATVLNVGDTYGNPITAADSQIVVNACVNAGVDAVIVWGYARPGGGGNTVLEIQTGIDTMRPYLVAAKTFAQPMTEANASRRLFSVPNGVFSSGDRSLMALGAPFGQIDEDVDPDDLASGDGGKAGFVAIMVKVPNVRRRSARKQRAFLPVPLVVAMAIDDPEMVPEPFRSMLGL